MILMHMIFGIEAFENDGGFLQQFFIGRLFLIEPRLVLAWLQPLL